VAVLAVAVIVAAAGLFSWWRAAHDDKLALARTRDAVLIAATSHIETLNSLDYRHIDAGLAKWRQVTTGTLHDQLSQVSANEQKLLADQKKVSTGKVVDAAVFSLDGTSATVVASVEVSVKDELHPDQAATLKRNRFSADMVEVHGRWLVENLQQVAVNIS
jgi:Mce-associated membrane protein